MDFITEYHKIRPYNNSEVTEAINRLIKNKNIYDILGFLYSERDAQEVINEFKALKTIEEFQKFFSNYAVKKILKLTSEGITISGLNNIKGSQPHLFISNHRDIVLDSAIMQSVLHDNNIPTSQIACGDNLLSTDFIIDLGKLNKMFTFYRSGSKMQLYKNALLHSQYIHHVITHDKQSMWISQRDGRTKDGNDKTQLALLKMLTVSSQNQINTLTELNIIPVSISYEFEPCAAEKVQEIYIGQSQVYEKAPGEDLKSILSGIKGYKGKIHIAFGQSLNTTLLNIQNQEANTNELSELITKELDIQIHKNFMLWPNNYIASDLLSKTDKYLNLKYSVLEKNNFIEYLNKKIETLHGDKIELEILFLKLYATPVINADNL